MADTPTKDQWKEIEKKLESPWGSVMLLVDGYRLSLSVQQLKTRRYTIVVYVNGWLRGEWILKDCEERRRFFNPKKVFLFPPKVRADFQKKFGKRRYAGSTIDKSFISYAPHWTSFAALRRHLIANNNSIEVLPDGEA